MMGPKTLTEIRQEIREAFAKKRLDPLQWFEREISQCRKSARPDRRHIEGLVMLRDALDDSVAGKPKKTRKKRVRAK